jgi:hypothetical protein
VVDLWSKCPIRKLWQIFKSSSMPNFSFSEAPKYFSYFYSLLLIYLIRKKIEIGKITVGHFSPRPAQLGSASPQSSRQSRLRPSVSAGRCQVGLDTSRTPPVSLTSSWAGNCYAPDLLPRPLRSNPSPSSAATPSITTSQIPAGGPATRHHPPSQGCPRVRLPP